jgi:hypothetical protein
MTIFVLIVGALGLLLAGALFGAWLLDGYWQERMRQERRAQLDAVWRTWQAGQRINTAFWIAREAVRREAERQQDAKRER